MICVVITGPPREGRYPYRIETVGTRLATPYRGLDAEPLYHACRKLQEWGAADDNAAIGLFKTSDSSNEFEGLMLGGTPVFFDLGRLIRQTTIGYGASAAAPATPEAEPPPPHKSPEFPTDKDQGSPKSNKPKKSHHPHLRAGSSARQGRR